MQARGVWRYIGPKSLALIVGTLFAVIKTYSSGYQGDMPARLSSRQLAQVQHLERKDTASDVNMDFFKPREKVEIPAFRFQEADKPKVKLVKEEDKSKETAQDTIVVKQVEVKPAEKVKPAADTKQKDLAAKPKAIEEAPKIVRASQVVNPHPFKVHLSNPDLCKINDLFIIVYVHTASDHYKRRAIIRQTWGNIQKFPNIRVLFVMGNTSSVPMMQSALEFEAQTYKDILQEDFEDTYRNLTYKGIAALKWISQNCDNAKYILKTDDDVFVNMYTIQNHFKLLQSAGYKDNLILCLVWWKMHALREGKWGIPIEDYPDSLYPPYCSGMAYMFSIDVAAKLYDVSFYVKFFWVDDVYMSGMLPTAVGLNHTTMIKAYCGKNEMEDLFTHPTEWYKYAFTHIHDEDMFLRVWDRLSAIAAKDGSKIPPPNKVEPGLLADTYLPKDKVVKKQEQGKKG